MLLQRIFNSPSWKVNKCLSPGVYLSTSSSFKEQKIIVGNYEINYLRVGRGPHHVFCAGASMTTIWHSFEKQIKGFDHDKFSLVVWDPPGYGQSVALVNNKSFNIFSIDADVAYEFMKAIQIPKYSLMGWSRGGTACLILARRHPEVVNKVVAWGACSFLLPKDVEYYTSMRNLDNWPKQLKDEMIKLYGKEKFITKVNELADTMIGCSKHVVSVCNDIRGITCPTLLLHGAKDPVVDSSHLKHLHSLIANSRIYLYPDGKHNIHIQYADDFNKRVQEFLLT
ncbi:unnamed protein product [Euphydryas editha]|uniref:AB hydrolase-1 domain-containing protein n=1 Tax=Euphydryas editha TaxID=104508 RepID=A0AAU9TDQ6_EUPED|nr:unnamed protein product [Euphydryas editha]